MSKELIKKLQESDKRNRKMLKLWNAGWSHYSIAVLYDVSRARVQQICAKITAEKKKAKGKK